MSIVNMFRKKRPIPAQIRSIGILLPYSTGTCVLTQALLTDMKASSPKTQVILFAPAEISALAKLMGYADHVVKIDYTQIAASARLIKLRKPDVLIDLNKCSKSSALLCHHSEVQHIRGFCFENKGADKIYDSTVLYRSDVHELDNIKAMQVFSLVTAGTLPRISLPNQPPDRQGRAVLHIAPGGAGSARKAWPIEFWEILLLFFIEKDFEVHFTGAEENSEMINKLIEKFSNKKLHNAAGELSMVDTAVLLKSAEIVVAVDSGIMHLASALQCNLVALFGPTHSRRWGPLNRNSISLNSPHTCAPCVTEPGDCSCPDLTGECMRLISPQMVIESVIRLLDTDIKV